MESQDEQIREPIPSEEGSTQGAVDGEVFFNVALNHVLKDVNAELVQDKDGAFVAIANYIVGCIKPTRLREFFARFEALNLQINYRKCHILADSEQVLQQNNKIITSK